MEPPTMVSRRVSKVPIELAPALSASCIRTCVVCETEVTESYLPNRCWDCDLRLYCSDECRRQGFTAHKSDRNCDQIAAAIQKGESVLNQLEHPARPEWYQSHFPGEFDGDNHGDLMGGRFAEDPFLKPALDCYSDLAFKGAHHPTLAGAVEDSLELLLMLKQGTYLADPYNLDVRIASVLLKLYREDDVVGFILYWLDWRSRGRDLDDLRDDRMLNIEDGALWPFPIVEDARLLDISGRLCSFPEQDVGTSVPIEFALTVLVIKARFITVYLSRAKAATLYLNATGFRQLTNEEDTQSHIISFLVAGGRERYEVQRTHANQLMDYIDGRDATLLPALVDPSIQQNRGEQQVNFETFLDEYTNGKPVVHTIRSMLAERYRKKVTASASS